MLRFGGGGFTFTLSFTFLAFLSLAFLSLAFLSLAFLAFAFAGSFAFALAFPFLALVAHALCPKKLLILYKLAILPAPVALTWATLAHAQVALGARVIFGGLLCC